jgi:hypothetical protein
MIKERLEQEIEMWEGIGYPALIQRFVLSKGKEQKKNKTTLPRGEQKQCFMNASHAAFEHSIKYVEGYVLDPTLPILIEHAWVSRDGIHAEEVTMDDSRELYYFGVEFTPSKLMKELAKTGVYGLFDTGVINVNLLFRLDPKLKEWFENFRLTKMGKNNIL